MPEPDGDAAIYAADNDDTDETMPGDGNVYEASIVDEDEPERRETAPKPVSGKRESTDQLVSLIWGGVGMALIHSGADVPVGRVLQLQAPLAGKKIDDIIAGTWIDHALQPLVSSASKMEGFGALIALPLMVALYERNETIGPMLEPMMREVVSATLIDMAPVLRKKRTNVRAAAKTIGDLREDLGLKKGEDPILAVLQSIFKPVGEDSPGEGTEE